MADRDRSKRKIALSAMLAVTFCTVDVNTAKAQSAPDNDSGSSWRVNLGIGAGLVRQYSGSKTYKISPIPLVDIT